MILSKSVNLCYCSVARSCPTLCSMLGLPCPSPSPGVHPSSCPLNQWCHPTISSSAALFSFRLQSSPASGSFPMSQLFTSGLNLCESLSIPCKIKTMIYVSHDFCWYSNDRKYARLRAKALWRMEVLINNLIRMFKKLDISVLETVWNWTSDLSACISSSCYSKMPWTEWFKQQKLSSHNSGGWTSKIKVPTRLVSPEASLLGL